MVVARNFIVQLAETLIVRAHYIFLALVPAAIVIQVLRAERTKEIVDRLAQKPGWSAGYVPFWHVSATWMTNVGIFILFALCCYLLKLTLRSVQHTPAENLHPAQMIRNDGNSVLNNKLTKTTFVIVWATIIALIAVGITDVANGIQSYSNIDRSIITRMFLSVERSAEKFFMAAVLYYLLELAISLTSRRTTPE